MILRRASILVFAAAVGHFVVAWLLVALSFRVMASQFESGDYNMGWDVLDWIATALMQPALFIVNHVELPSPLGVVVFALNSLGWGYAIVAAVLRMRRRAGRTSLAAPPFVDFWLGVFAYLWAFGGAYLAISRFRSGDPAMALLGVLLFIAAIGIWYSKRWAAIALLTHWTIISAAGAILLFGRGFSPQVALSTAMAVFFVVILTLRLRTSAGLFLVMLFLSTACGEPEFPGKRPQDVARTIHADVLRDEDIEVYESLIADFAKHGRILGMGSPRPQDRHALSNEELKRRSAEVRIYLQPYTEIPAGPAYPAHDYGWMIVDGTISGPIFVPQSAAADLNARNQQRVSLVRFRPRHLTVHRVATLPRNLVLRLSLPGYSLPRDAALVVVSSRHEQPPYTGMISQIVYLRKKGGVWHVVGEQPRWIL